MKLRYKVILIAAAAMVVAAFSLGLASCGTRQISLSATTDEERQEIENTLNLAKNQEVTWNYDSQSDSWTMSVTSAVANPELADYQGVSVNVPGAYIKGVDTDGDGEADVTADTAPGSINGTLVLDHSAKIKNENGQTYTADTAPVIINTGAAGYSAQQNQVASSDNAAYGYINVACGNRGKQSTATDENGKTYYTGDAPLCLVDQKNAIRFVKYNVALGNLPGSTDYFVSTGGSGGGAHAAMVAATSDNSDYFPYEVEAGAVGVYANEDGSYSETVDAGSSGEVELSDGVWGCVAYSAITSLQEADMAMAFEYYMDTDYEFNTDFQEQLAKYLSQEYMEYINDLNLGVSESAVGIDLNDDGDQDDTVDLSIEYDEEKYADTNGYGGTYLTLYLKEFEHNLEWYLENLDYADGWTWFGENGTALSTTQVQAMTTEEKAQAFLEGRYAKSQSSDNGGPGGGSGAAPGGASGGSTPPSGSNGGAAGTPDAGTTQSTGNTTDSANYSSYKKMLKAYEKDISSIESGDKYGNNIVDLYDPLQYIGDEDTDDPAWTRIVMGASEGDMSLFSSMNMQIAWLSSGTDAKVEWQWDGGHVPSEIFGESLSLYIDEMYGQYVDGAAKVTKAEAQSQTAGTASEATGTDISSWASYSKGSVSFSLADTVSYRTQGACKAVPGFDVMDYGQETYEFGSESQDARHFDKYVLKVLQEQADTLPPLFNKN